MIDETSLREALGPDARLHHVGLAVASLDAIAPTLERWHDPTQRVHVAFSHLADTRVEFVQPEGEDSPVHAALARGQRLLHLCFEVPELGAAIASAKRHGFSVLQRPVPAVAFGGRRIAWLFSRVLGLVELLEVAPAGDA